VERVLFVDALIQTRHGLQRKFRNLTRMVSANRLEIQSLAVVGDKVFRIRK